MICTEIELLTPRISTDNIGVQRTYYNRTKVPIIKVEDIYSNEFYQANEQGLKPELRIKISALNYNGEQEFIYNDVRYFVIRTSTPNIDEVVLISQRKLKNIGGEK